MRNILHTCNIWQHQLTIIPPWYSFFLSPFFIFTFFSSSSVFNEDRLEAAQNISIQQTLLDRRSNEKKFVRKRKLWAIGALIDIDRDRERYAAPSPPRGRDPCLCWPAVGVVLSQALLSASSMKSAIARNCLELAQSNHPPFPVRIRAYINR